MAQLFHERIPQDSSARPEAVRTDCSVSVRRRNNAENRAALHTSELGVAEQVPSVTHP